MAASGLFGRAEFPGAARWWLLVRSGAHGPAEEGSEAHSGDGGRLPRLHAPAKQLAATADGTARERRAPAEPTPGRLEAQLSADAAVTAK